VVGLQFGSIIIAEIGSAIASPAHPLPALASRRGIGKYPSLTAPRVGLLLPLKEEAVNGIPPSVQRLERYPADRRVDFRTGSYLQKDNLYYFTSLSIHHGSTMALYFHPGE